MQHSRHMQIKRSIPESDRDLIKQYVIRNRHKHDCFMLLQLMLITGARVSEACAIRPCDLEHMEYGLFNITIAFASKGSLKREWEIDSLRESNVCEVLLAKAEKHRLADTTPLYRIFCKGSKASGARMLSRHFEDICFELFKDRQKYSLHCIRHAFGELAYKASNGDILNMKYALGHKDLRSTQHYCTFFDQSKLKKKMKGIA